MNYSCRVSIFHVLKLSPYLAPKLTTMYGMLEYTANFTSWNSENKVDPNLKSYVIIISTELGALTNRLVHCDVMELTHDEKMLERNSTKVSASLCSVCVCVCRGGFVRKIKINNKYKGGMTCSRRIITGRGHLLGLNFKFA